MVHHSVHPGNHGGEISRICTEHVNDLLDLYICILASSAECRAGRVIVELLERCNLLRLSCVKFSSLKFYNLFHGSPYRS